MRAKDDRKGEAAGWRGVPRRLRRLVAFTVPCVVAGVLLTVATGGAATSATTVSLTVPSAVSLTNQCTDPTAYGLGVVLPGSTTTSATAAGRVCRIAFGSSNDASMLRVAQQDGSGSAMSTPDPPALNVRTPDSAGHVNRAAMANASVGLAVGRSASIRRTIDGGATWTSWLGVTMNGWWSDVDVDPVNQQAWVLVGGSAGEPHVIESTNVVSSAPAAPTWTDRSAALVASGWPATVDVNGVAVVSSSTWLLCGVDGYVAATTDSGATFAVFKLPGVSWCTDVDAVSASTLFLVTDIGVFQTTTGGATVGSWLPLPVPDGESDTLDARDATHVWISDVNGSIEKWNGSTWAGVVGVSGGHSLTEVLASPGAPDTIWAPLRDGAGVARSTNAGASWSLLPVDPDVPMTAVAPSSATTAVAFGEAGSIFSSPTGTSMTTVSTTSASPSWWGIATDPTNGQRVAAVGSGGSIIRSADGGSTFTKPASGMTTGLHAVVWSSSTGLWAVGEAGVILRSTDAGVTWSSQTTPVAEDLWAISAIDDYVAWAVGRNGTVLRTTNGGTTWTSMSYPTTAWLRAVSSTSATSAIVGGNNSTGTSADVRRTSNGGTSWSLSATLGTWDAVRGLATGDGGATTYLATSNDGLESSTDGGATFQSARPLWSGDSSVSVSGAEVVTGGTSSVSFATHDGGANWSFDYRGTDDDDLAVAAVDGHGYWVAGAQSGISRTKEAASGAVIDDFGAGHLWSSGTATSTFGMCVQAVTTATIATGWTVDGGTCTSVDTDPWAPVPAAATKLAELTSGASGSVDVVWGMRAKSSQPPATYTAAVVFEALAPDA